MVRRRKTFARWLCLLLVPLLGCDGNGINSGDRVLVAKCLYGTGIKPPARFDVVVFKYPGEPVKDHVPHNYIKRLMGLPGEIIAIFFGQIFRMTPPPGEALPGTPVVDNPLNLWKKENQPHGREWDEKVKEWFEGRKFDIIRKPPEVMMAMRRIVNDNNYQPSDLKNFPARWQPRPDSRWSMAGDRKTFAFKTGEQKDVDWLTYQHLVRPQDVIAGNTKIKPQLITDFMGYNAYNKKTGDPNWAGDLMLEAKVATTDAAGEFLMELNRGVNRFQARWDLKSGECTLFRIEMGKEPVELGKAATTLRGAGTRVVRFANFDARLTVWVDRALPFGDGVAFDPPEFAGSANWGPTLNDIERPASLGSNGAAVAISDLRLWRDTYYTMAHNPNNPDIPANVIANPDDWGRFKELTPHGFYVSPGHYMCLGDNSTHSSDSRFWGMVPERLMLGRALMIYFPLHRAGLIR